MAHDKWARLGLCNTLEKTNINCDDEPRMKQLFELDYNIERILITIQAITGVRVTPCDTLIIFDEIQEIPRGLHSLKCFCEKAPEYHIMVAGSLLGAKENKKFVYGAVRQGCRAKNFELAIQWLMDAGILHKVSRIREPKMPLKFYEDIDAFKLFLLDHWRQHLHRV